METLYMIVGSKETVEHTVPHIPVFFNPCKGCSKSVIINRGL